MDTNFDFGLEPGRKLKKINYKDKDPEISIVVPFYNDLDYIEQSIISLLNQTYPYFEILIIDDGSTDIASLNKLKEVEKLDSRIKVFHKKNEGLAATRDYGAKVASPCTNYLMFMDSDDLVNPTYLECAYWTLILNESASWAYSDTVGFGVYTYRWNKMFDSAHMKKENTLIATSVIRKEAFMEVGGYGLKEKAVNEDWNFWLKQISKGNIPVHMNFYGQWYRRKEHGELAKASANKKRTLEIISKTIEQIKEEVKAIEYPKYDYRDEDIRAFFNKGVVPNWINNKKMSILVLIPKMSIDENDRLNLKIIEALANRGYEITLITNVSCINESRQQFEEYANVFDLSTFLDQRDWLSFINYVIESRQIDVVFNIDENFGHAVLPIIKNIFNDIPIIDFLHDIKNVDNKILDLVNKVLVSSHENAKELESIYGKKINKIEVLPFKKDRDKRDIESDDVSDKIDVIFKEFKNLDKKKISKYHKCSNGNEYLTMLSTYFKDNVEDIESYVKNYVYNTYYKKEAISLLQRVKNALWKIPIWRCFVSSSFWKTHIKKSEKK